MNENPCSKLENRQLFEHGFKLSYLHDVIIQWHCIESQMLKFVRKKVAYGYDIVMTFESLQLTTFCYGVNGSHIYSYMGESFSGSSLNSGF